VSKIHPSALVHRSAEIGEDVTVGPYSVIGDRVRIGANAVVLKRSLATDLMRAVDALLAGQRYLSPEISR